MPEKNERKDQTPESGREDLKSFFTCMYVGLAKEQRQTFHSFKRVEVVNTLMKTVHAILVLKHRSDKLDCID